VKYLASKALRNHGINPDDLDRGLATAAETPDVDSSNTGVLALQGGVRAFWRTAQEYLRVPFNTLCRLIQVNPDLVGEQVLESVEGLGVDMLLPHLHESPGSSPAGAATGAVAVGAAAGAPARLADVARRWHSQPRTALYPERSDVRGSGLEQSVAPLRASGEPLVRALACRLGPVADRLALDQLVVLLSDPQPLIHRAAGAALALAGCRRREFQARILGSASALFKPGEDESRLLTVARLARDLANPTILPFLREQLPQSAGAVRAMLVDVLARLPVPEAEKIALVGSYLRDPSPDVVTRAMACLWTSSQRSFITYTLSRYMNHRDPGVRSRLAEALSDVGGEDAASYLVQLLRDPDPSVRAAAAGGVERTPGDRVAALLAALLGADHAPAVRAAALRALAANSGPDTLTELRNGLAVTDRPPAIRVECAGGIPGTSPRGSPLVAEIALDEQSVRLDGLGLLECLGVPKALPVVEAMVLERDPHVKARAAALLWKLGELWAADSVGELLSSANPADWGPAISALGDIAYVSRMEARLMQYPLLRTALRRHPSFAAHTAAKKK
jgi:HEAT repeat protein